MNVLIKLDNGTIEVGENGTPTLNLEDNTINNTAINLMSEVGLCDDVCDLVEDYNRLILNSKSDNENLDLAYKEYETRYRELENKWILTSNKCKGLETQSKFFQEQMQKAQSEATLAKNDQKKHLTMIANRDQKISKQESEIKQLKDQVAKLKEDKRKLEKSLELHQDYWNIHKEMLCKNASLLKELENDLKKVKNDIIVNDCYTFAIYKENNQEEKVHLTAKPFTIASNLGQYLVKCGMPISTEHNYYIVADGNYNSTTFYPSMNNGEAITGEQLVNHAEIPDIKNLVVDFFAKNKDIFEYSSNDLGNAVRDIEKIFEISDKMCENFGKHELMREVINNVKAQYIMGQRKK